MGLILALNALNTPWIALIVIVLGMAFEIVCKVFGIGSDAATGVIGAGIGLLTGQGLRAMADLHVQNQTQPWPQPLTPSPSPAPAAPAASTSGVIPPPTTPASSSSPTT